MKLPDIPPASVDEKESLFISRNLNWEGGMAGISFCFSSLPVLWLKRGAKPGKKNPEACCVYREGFCKRSGVSVSQQGQNSSVSVVPGHTCMMHVVLYAALRYASGMKLFTGNVVQR